MVRRTRNMWVFRIRCPDACSVSVVGDFNDWDPYAAPMQRVGPDHWMSLLELEPGEHRFRYLVDGGRWLTDFAAFGVERNHLREWNSVVYVPDAPAPDHQPIPHEQFPLYPYRVELDAEPMFV